MDASQNPDTELMVFDRYSMEEGVPISMLFSMTRGRDKCGIYILEFADGARYVGQTTNIVKRYGEHQHNHGDIVAFSFASCEPHLLDAHERAVIRLQEQGHDLRNKLLTDLPGGRGDLEIEVSEAATVKLPWNRSSRTTIFHGPNTTKEGRFWQLAQRQDYPDIRAQLARYVHATIPSPLQTAGMLWTLTGLPSTNRTRDMRRLLTLNVSNVEALFLTEYDLEDGGIELEWVLNAWHEGLPPMLAALEGDWLDKADYLVTENYATAGPVVAVTSIDTPTFAHVLDQGFILDAAYRLNVTMMRRSKSVFARFHNEAFASDIFREISRTGARQ